jgi:cyclase
VKTVKFSDPKYVGDPINAVRIFNEKEVDELMVVDIDATTSNTAPDYRMIEHLAAECRMPLCYGGGVKTADQAKTIIGLGVEKVAISSAAIAEPALISRVADEVGSQSVVVVLDTRRRKFGGKYEIHTHNGSRATGQDPVAFAQLAEQHGAGELVINSIDHDGVMKGYDLALAAKVRDAISIPMTVLGGAGSLEHVGELIRQFGIVGAAAGSLFVFKGVYRAVLINYPATAVRDQLIRDNFVSAERH